jgi:class 3 adenylate cyclase
MVTSSSQTATILVTDLVDSTAQRVRLGEERAEVLRRTHDGLVADAVTAHGGEVVKGLGDGVLALFGAAADAVAAAVAVQQAVSAHSGRHREEVLSVRVGISAGDVTLEDGDCFGTPVVEASRLCAESAGGEILVADLVRLLARGRGGHEFVSVGERVLRGLPEAVSVARVGWSAAPPASAPIPGGLQVGQWFEFAGRAQERELLAGRWKAATHGEPGLVVVSGEPGVGKTRLVAELAASAHADGATVLYGRSEAELDVAFRPWAEALQYLVAHIPEDVVAAHVQDWGGDLTRLVPGLDATPTEGIDPDTERLRLFGAASDLLDRAAEESPVLVVLDDLHWADESSLLLLRHLVRHRGEARVLLVGTYRDTDLTRTHPLAAALADLRREEGVQRVDLTGLDQAEVVDFLARAAGGDTGGEDVADLARLVWSETEGNPFFISEILAHLVESGALVQREGRWHGDQGLIDQIGLPEGIREVVGRRLVEFSDPANEILRTAAVVGPTFDASVVAVALDGDVDDVVAALDDAVARRLVVEDDDVLDRFRFVHALVRQTLFEEVRTSHRVRLHHKIALALEERGAGAADLAHHFGEAAARADAVKAVDYAGRAAEEATERLAFEQAVRFRRLAVDADDLVDPPDDARRAELLVALGEARNTAGDPVTGRDDFVAAADAARRAGRIDLLARAARGYGGGDAAWLDLTDAVGPALLDEALEALPAQPSIERALCLAHRSHWRLREPDPAERLRQAEEAVTMAEAIGDPTTLWSTLTTRAQALQGALDAAELRRVAERIHADFAGGSRGAYFAHYYRMAAEFITGDLAAFRSLLAEVQALDPRLLGPNYRWAIASAATNLALDDGRFDEMVAASAAETQALGHAGASLAQFHEVQLRHRRGDHHEAAEIARRSVPDNPDWWGAWPILAWADWLDGASAAAADELRAWAEGILPVLPAAFRVNAVALAAPIASDLDLVDLSDELAAILRPHRGKWATSSIETDNGLVDHALGLVDHAAGRTEQGEAELRAAVADYRQAGTQARLTEALADLAALTDDAKARAEALELADDLGMSGVTSRLTS